MSREHRRTLARIIKAKGEFMAVDGFAIPRVYVSLHGTPKCPSVHELAEKYGWRKAMKRE